MVEIVVSNDAQRCRWMLTDQGRGFDVQATIERLSQCDPQLLEFGRGIILMRSYFDCVDYRLGGRRVILTLNHQPAAGGVVLAGTLANAKPQAATDRDESDDRELRAVYRAIAFLIDRSIGLIESTDEHRLHPRVVYNERIEVVSPQGSPLLPGFARDLSMGGIAFITAGPLIGEITIVLPTDENHPPLASVPRSSVA